MYMQQEVLIFAFIDANLTYKREVSVAFICCIWSPPVKLPIFPKDLLI